MLATRGAALRRTSAWLSGASRHTGPHLGSRPISSSQKGDICAAMATAIVDAQTLAPDVYHMGPSTLQISRSKLHQKIRSRVAEGMRKVVPSDQQGVILVQGGSAFYMYTSDSEPLFRQEAYFHHLFGVAEEDWFGAIDVRNGKALLFMPRLPEAYAVWMGRLKTPAECAARFAVDAVYYTDEMASILQGLGAPCLHVLSGANTDSGMSILPVKFDGVEQFKLDTETSHLFTVATETRVHKSEEEIEILRYVNRIGSEAHVAMMRAARPGMMEYQLESVFLHHAYHEGGCRTGGYTPIAGSGPNAAILHYGHAGAPNDRQMRNGDLVLCDMGCEYYRIGSDITTTFPVNGRFTQQQRAVYEAVLEAHSAVIAAMKPGVAWTDMHELSYRIILKGLAAASLVRGSVDDMMAHNIGALFMPHGLGHFLGLDTHDVGGYMPGMPNRSARPGFSRLRTARFLEPGMVITVEPGVYFNPALLLPALEDPVQSQFLVRDAVLAHLEFGGVRLEDNVVVTQAGAESLTNVPRRCEDVEAVMAGAPWPPQPAA